MSQALTAEALDELEATARAALPRSWDEHQQWRDEFGFNNGGCPSRFFYIPQHNGGAKVEMLAEVSEHIVAFQPETAIKLLESARRYLELTSAMEFIHQHSDRTADLPGPYHLKNAERLCEYARRIGWQGAKP